MATTQCIREIITFEKAVVLSVAGSDCSAGAGIQADLKAFQACGVFGLTAVTGVVAEIPGQVVGVELVSSRVLDAQLQVLLQNYPVQAAKTGMLCSGEQVGLVAARFSDEKRRNPAFLLVVDPVMVASSGDRLADEGMLVESRRSLWPMADLLTPNLAESLAMLGAPNCEEPMETTARRLFERFGVPVLLKGGHADDPGLSTDVLVSAAGCTRFEAIRIPRGERIHGTGCTLSAWITAHLALGLALPDAVSEAKERLLQSMKRAHSWGQVRALAVP